mmetsp:Transcript_1217/g.3254  ORF Transcript_1217/g.3254 Transcript_1217/m.3254 type:complete len:114 (+) Transcript_1217:1818-2159(+)
MVVADDVHAPMVSRPRWIAELTLPPLLLPPPERLLDRGGLPTIRAVEPGLLFEESLVPLSTDSADGILCVVYAEARCGVCARLEGLLLRLWEKDRTRSNMRGHNQTLSVVGQM